jgi:hypothetical protein
MFHVYHISDKNNLQYGYIGVTNDINRRWKTHEKSYYTIGKHIRMMGWTISNMKIIFSGDEQSCYDLEIKLRPVPNIGLNESAGGQGGNKYSGLSEEFKIKRNQKISEKLKNRNHTWGSKVSETRKLQGLAKGLKNNRAKKWKLIDPNGQEYHVDGDLENFCKNKQILRSCLRRYINKTVPPIQKNGFGGYREKNELSKKLREHTTGWTLFVMEK